MSKIGYLSGSSTSLVDDWNKENTPKEGVYRVYWKGPDVTLDYEDSFVDDTGGQLRYEWYCKSGSDWPIIDHPEFDARRADGMSTGWRWEGTLKQEWVWKSGIPIVKISYDANGQRRLFEILFGDEYFTVKWDKNGNISDETIDLIH